MEKLTEVLAMDGYGAYVWPSFAIAIAVMAAMAFFSLRSLRRAQKTWAALQESNEA